MTQDSSYDTLITLPIAILFLHPDAGTVPAKAIEREVAEIQAAGAVPPITCVPVAEDCYYVIEPVARFLAAQQLGYTQVPVHVFQGTWFEALTAIAGSKETKQSRLNRDNLIAATEKVLRDTLGYTSVRGTAEVTPFSRNEIDTAHKRQRLHAYLGEPGQPADAAALYKIADRDLPFYLGDVTPTEHRRRKQRTAARTLLAKAGDLVDSAPSLLTAVLLTVLKQVEPTMAKRVLRHAAEAHGFTPRDFARPQQRSAGRTKNGPKAPAASGKPAEKAMTTEHHGSRTTGPRPYAEVGLVYDTAKNRLTQQCGRGVQAAIRRETGVDDRRISETLKGQRVAEAKLIDAIARRIVDDVRAGRD